MALSGVVFFDTLFNSSFILTLFRKKSEGPAYEYWIGKVKEENREL